MKMELERCTQWFETRGVDERQREGQTKHRVAEEKKHENKEHWFVLITDKQCVY